VEVRRRGTPGFVICSTAFETLARAQARALDCADQPMIVIPHPFGNRTRDAVRELADFCGQEILRLTGGT